MRCQTLKGLITRMVSLRVGEVKPLNSGHKTLILCLYKWIEVKFYVCQKDRSEISHRRDNIVLTYFLSGEGEKGKQLLDYSMFCV